MEIVKLFPAIQEYIWGGHKLKKFYGKQADNSTIAETWELSFREEAPTIIASGLDKGKLLKDVARKSDLGSNVTKFSRFPLLIKLIDSESDLSIQVHPSDEFALTKEEEYGKSEMWYILECEEGAGLYLGFKRKTDANEVRQKANDGTITELLNFIKVKPGDTYFIPSGTVHAIGKGITLVEIQQNSNLTYRLYDYNRLGKEGKPRELHLEKALKVLDYDEYKKPSFKKPLIGECKYFSSSYFKINEKTKIAANPFSFMVITFISGSGKIDSLEYNKGDSFFIPAMKETTITGYGAYILTEVKK